MQKISGMNKQADGSWKIKINGDLYKLTNRKNIVRVIKSRIAWVEHLERLQDLRLLWNGNA